MQAGELAMPIEVELMRKTVPVCLRLTSSPSLRSRPYYFHRTYARGLHSKFPAVFAVGKQCFAVSFNER